MPSSSRNTGTFDNVPASPNDTLRKTFEKLQEIKALINGLSDRRRGKILIAAQSGACHSLEDLELDLDRCVPPNPIAVCQWF